MKKTLCLGLALAGVVQAQQYCTMPQIPAASAGYALSESKANLTIEDLSEITKLANTIRSNPNNYRASEIVQRKLGWTGTAVLDTKVLVSYKSSNQYDLYIIDTANENSNLRLTSTAVNEIEPTFGPGGRICYTVQHRGRPNLYVIIDNGQHIPIASQDEL